MLEFIIWMIIIVAIFMRSKKKTEQNRQNGQRPVQQNYRPQSQADMAAKQRELKQRLQQKYAGQIQQQRQAQPQQRPVQQMQQQTPQYRAPQPQPVQQNPQYRAPQPQQRPVQQTPQHRAPQPQQRPVQSMPQQNVRKGDILERASENVRMYEEDMLEKSELMEELNDLMLMGYRTKLSYERDFVAEGIELLNSYELPVA